MKELRRMVELEVQEPTHHFSAKRMLTYIDRQFCSLPGWLCLQLSLAGSVVEPPEMLNRRGISDHSPVQVTISPGGKPSPVERPVPPEVCDHPEYRKFLEAVESQCDQSSLTPPLRLQFHTEMMREAAKIARDSMIIHTPEAPFTRLMIVKAIGRAVWRQDIQYAQKVQRSHELGRLFLRIDPLAGTVELVDPPEFQRRSNSIHEMISIQKQANIRKGITDA